MPAPNHEPYPLPEPPSPGEGERAHNPDDTPTPDVETPADPATTIETKEAGAQKVGMPELLSGAHVGRVALTKLSARLAERRERLVQPQSPNALRNQKIRRAGILMGATAAGYAAARYFDLPPLAITSSAIANRLSRSPNVAASGAPIAPEKQDATIRRAGIFMDRLRERKKRRRGAQ
jgi:hypothetical protein